MVRMKKICGDCEHYAACASWNIGSISSMDATHCANFKKFAASHWDTIEVIRCAKCIYWEPECVEEGDSCGHCRNQYAPCENQQTDMDWFCGSGERVKKQ